VKVTECVRTWCSLRYRRKFHHILHGLRRLGLLERIVIIRWRPEVSNEVFEIFRVFVSNMLEENPVLISIEHVHAAAVVVHAVVHGIPHIAAVVIHVIHTIPVAVDIAIEYARQRLVSESIKVDVVTTRVELIVTAGIVGINDVHHVICLRFYAFVILLYCVMQ